mmetsp:Transcript_3743/g.16418  ORF Transcript_3743/g.16418 Transcript_3743/m.16418 type:complete len:392 (+) Transcript_3743:2565-3740(+)
MEVLQAGREPEAPPRLARRRPAEPARRRGEAPQVPLRAPREGGEPRQKGTRRRRRRGCPRVAAAGGWGEEKVRLGRARQGARHQRGRLRAPRRPGLEGRLGGDRPRGGAARRRRHGSVLRGTPRALERHRILEAETPVAVRVPQPALRAARRPRHRQRGRRRRGRGGRQAVRPGREGHAPARGDAEGVPGALRRVAGATRGLVHGPPRRRGFRPQGAAARADELRGGGGRGGQRRGGGRGGHRVFNHGRGSRLRRQAQRGSVRATPRHAVRGYQERPAQADARRLPGRHPARGAPGHRRVQARRHRRAPPQGHEAHPRPVPGPEGDARGMDPAEGAQAGGARGGSRGGVPGRNPRAPRRRLRGHAAVLLGPARAPRPAVGAGCAREQVAKG